MAQRSDDFGWNQSFFFWFSSKIYDLDPEADQKLEALMGEHPDWCFPTFDRPLHGDGFKIRREDDAILVEIDDLEKAREFCEKTPDRRKASQNQMVLLVAAAILQAYIGEGGIKHA